LDPEDRPHSGLAKAKQMSPGCKKIVICLSPKGPNSGHGFTVAVLIELQGKGSTNDWVESVRSY
jgi:hypothetical protein